MELRSGYLTPVQSQERREASDASDTSDTPDGSASECYESAAESEKAQKEQSQQQQADVTTTVSKSHQSSAVASFPAFPSAPICSTYYFDQSGQFSPFMSRLPHDTVVKVEGGDWIGGLDPQYFELYSAGAAGLPPTMNGSNASQESIYEMVYGTSQLPAAMTSLNLPCNAGTAGVNDFNLGAPMALPNLNMAMEPIPVPIALSMEPDVNTGPDNNPNAIPLLCHICPKKPTFSDVSHLLTHISSKSHLAARFKLQLSDVASHKQALQHFDEWADHYGINKLLKNRQDAKEQKKQNSLKRQRGGNEKKPRRSNGARTEVKLEQTDSLHHQLENNPLNQGSWHLHTPHASFNDPFQTPPIKRVESVYPLPDSPLEIAFMNDATDAVLVQDSIEAIDGGSGAAKLKGVVLPGMDLFDAATPDQKRMRNQKKHESVLKNMTRDSELIEQTEYVWDDQLLCVARTRNVYDSPSVDGSPESKDEEVPVTKKRRARRVVSTGNGFQRQMRASTRGAKAAKRAATKSGKKGLKIEEVDSEDDNHDSQADHVIGGFENSIDDNLMGGDVFADRRLVMPEVNDNTMVGQQFNLGYRSAMQGLPSNRPMSSIFAKSDNQAHFGFYDKENDRAAFSLQQSGTMPGTLPSYFPQARHNMPSNGLNPLCVQRQGSPGFPYIFGSQSFDPPKPVSTPFQPMTVMDYSPITSGHHYQTGAVQNQNGAFDI